MNEASSLDAAVAAVREGTPVVPVPRGEKGPVIKGWPSLRLTEADLPKHFSNGENIGLILGVNGLTDVDLDSPESLVLADEILPPTTRHHGRASKPDSHRWYVVGVPPKPTKYADVDGTCLVELRSTGQQTLVPPSVHPCGERFVWTADGEPARVDTPTLEKAVARLAAASLLARHWPKRGSRHDCGLPLAGFLLRGGWSAEETEQFVSAVARAAGDEEVRSRLHDVRSTAAKLADDQAVTGGRTLSKLVGREVVERLRDWLELPSGGSGVEVVSPLHQAIRSVILDKELTGFDKRRKVTRICKEGLHELGEFRRTADGRRFFFHHAERCLYDLDQQPFQHLLTSISGLSSTEVYFRFALDILKADVSRDTPLSEVHTVASYDPTTGFLAVSDGAGGMWARSRRGEWEYARNGDNGVLFLTEPEATPFEPEFGANGRALQWFLDQFLFADHPLSRENQQTLLSLWLFHQFFPRLRRTRTIPACLGPQGSGKTTAERLIGRLLLGPEFDVSGIHRDREDAFVAAVTNRVFFGLDNADSRIPWLEDALARYATGERYRLRRLYTTNDEISYTPRAILMLSSRDPQFNRPDVAERLLPFYFERPTLYRPEEQIYGELGGRRGAIMGSLLTQLGQIADSLESAQAPSVAFRMADFAAFGWLVFAALGKAKEWEDLLKNLEKVQVAFASDGDGIIAALGVLLGQQGAIREVLVGDLFKRCVAVAQAQDLLFPRTAQAFGRRLSTLRRVIELELGVKFQEDYRHAGARHVTLTPRNGDKGGDGDAVEQKVSAEVG